MDNKTILMVVVAIVLGMLVANMFKEVCGCKNLIEGQFDIAQDTGCYASTGTPQLPASGMIMRDGVELEIPSSLPSGNDNSCGAEDMNRHCPSITKCSEKPTDYGGSAERWTTYCEFCCGAGT